MASFRFIISVSFFTLSSLFSVAQDIDTSITDDTLLYGTYTKEEYDAIIDKLPVDTNLIKNDNVISSTEINKLKETKSLSYAKNLARLLKEEQNKVASSDSGWLFKFLTSKITRYTFYALAVIFIGFILYRLFLSKGFFQRKATRAKVELLKEEEGLSAIADYDKLAAEAAANKNYRLAVRYLYLQSLQKLAAQGLIVFSLDKTNYQYVLELNNKLYKKDFASLTLNYEYVWYGEFEIDEERFVKIHNNFKAFKNQLS